MQQRLFVNFSPNAFWLNDKQKNECFQLTQIFIIAQYTLALLVYLKIVKYHEM